MTIRMHEIHRLGSVLTVWAHPDDEAYLASGLMAAVAARARRVACLTATAGELGTSAQHPDPARLGPRRRRELSRALAALGVQEHHVLGLPDGGCDDLGESAPVDRIRAAIEWFGADTVATFGPDGVTGHPDHCAVSRWVGLAVERVSRPVRVLHAVSTPEHMAEFTDIHEELGLDPDAPAVVERDDLAVHLVLDAPLLARKLAALRAHHSQTAPVFDAIGAQRMADWVREETFVWRE